MEVNTPAYVFIEHLFQYCLHKRGISWQPAPRNSQIGDAMLFNQTIGNAVMTTSLMFPARVQTYSRMLWNYICRLPDGETFYPLCQNILAVAYEIYSATKNNTIGNSYVFLAVMVEVSILCANHGKRMLIQDSAYITLDVLNYLMQYGFLRNFNRFATYAQNGAFSDDLGKTSVM